MGGEDWQMWIDALDDAGVLADGAKTTAYTYNSLFDLCVAHTLDEAMCLDIDYLIAAVFLLCIT